MGLEQKASTVTNIDEVSELSGERFVSQFLEDPPTSFDWRNFNGGDWMTVVKNQGSCGSCWSFAAVGVVEAQYNLLENNPDLDLDLSEQYLVSNCSGAGLVVEGLPMTHFNFL